jgi:hypothetical protein
MFSHEGGVSKSHAWLADETGPDQQGGHEEGVEVRVRVVRKHVCPHGDGVKQRAMSGVFPLPLEWWYASKKIGDCGAPFHMIAITCEVIHGLLFASEFSLAAGRRVP